ncbi:MAG: hypothetical protein IAE77_28425 [Prosthecobacter sp.]|uniref:hypothetical protein n=1 Tax=Prosthecobacter sp. TaxID=1965333 RepID=UPI0019F96939|nr:hypothetical protein [Prosthecobacter sp.]MBE2287414.1 hypothetical protein [Prosthecobacter sp.]
MSVVLFSLALLAAYVWHSQVTSNTAPPDPLGLRAVDSIRPSKANELAGPIKDSWGASGERPASDLRVIGSKAINQPIFSLRKSTAVGASEAAGVPVMYVRPMMVGSKSGPVHFFGLGAWRRLQYGWFGIKLDAYSDAEPKSSPLTPFSDFWAKWNSETINRGHDPFGSTVNAADPFAPLSNKPASTP